MERYICIHGHFYQPPRENPWLEAVELQDSAYPYHDWNERITAECYHPNTTARILDHKGKIVNIINNYSRISFNYGPSLIGWLEEQKPEVFDAIRTADVESQSRFSGHGSALAQAYNHMIMPLAKRRDKYLQVLWGIKDFEFRFGRKPEGMWLPETAVDLETLDILAEFNITFTILSPYQARRVRRIGERNWRDVSGGRIDPTMVYRIGLPSGKQINLFFYDGPVSQAVAFERLATNGEYFAQRLGGAFSGERTHAQLVHIATDGETYGHHTGGGQMGLAYALDYIEGCGIARLTNYGEYLEKHPATYEVEIYENSSWSCPHGIERWRNDCGCNSGGHPGWKQDWRGPLRQAFDWLRDSLTPTWERKCKTLLNDPWEAIHDYIHVILDRSSENTERFFSRHALRVLDEVDKITSLKLMEMKRHLMLMYTSCGWFFDEVSGIETIQVMRYAARALQIAEELLGDRRQSRFLDLLQNAKSNLPEQQDGRQVYIRLVSPSMIDLRRVAAHYGISSMFRDYAERSSIFCYDVERQNYDVHDMRQAKLALGRAKFTSRITQESTLLTFGVFFLGDHNISGGTREFRSEEAYKILVNQLSDAFNKIDFHRVNHLLDTNFGLSTFSLQSLFRDEQRNVVNIILASSLSRAGAYYNEIYERRVPLMRLLIDLSIPLPNVFKTAAEYTINSDLRHLFEARPFNLERISSLLAEAKEVNVAIDATTLEYSLRIAIEKMVSELAGTPMDHSLLKEVELALKLCCSLPFDVKLENIQNTCFQMANTVLPAFRERAAQGDKAAAEWVERFFSLGEYLGIRISTYHPVQPANQKRP